MADDGETALIGMPRDEGPSELTRGSAFVFERTDEEWRQQAKLVADDLSGVREFGEQLGLSGDGTTAVIGVSDPFEDSESPVGPFVFERTDAGWRQQADLIGEGSTEGDYFRSALAVSDDATTVIVGASADAVGANETGSGSAYVFDQTDGGWSQQAKLVPGDPDEADWFGERVAVSGDGTIAIIGAPGEHYPNETDAPGDDDPSGTRNDVWPSAEGAAYVFEQTDEGWSQQAKLAPKDDDLDDESGIPAISSDGTTAFMGDYHGRGSVHVFEQTDTGWSKRAELTALDEDNAYYDALSDIAVSNDGSMVMLGTPKDTEPMGVEGSASVFKHTDEGWSHRAKLAPDDSDAEDHIGTSIAMSSDGATALIGAPGDDNSNGEDGGAVYVYE